MKRFYILSALLALFAGSSGATTNSFTAPGSTTALQVQANGSSVVTIQASGSGSGMTFAAVGITPEGVSVTLPMIPVTCGAAITSGTANGNWVVGTSGYVKFQVNLTAIGGGTEVIATNGGTPPGFGCTLTQPAPGAPSTTVAIDQTTPGTTNGVNIAPGAAAALSPLSYTSAAAESGHVIQTGQTNAYKLYARSTVAGLFMTFNSATVPADGAVTPVECMDTPANSFSAHDLGSVPDKYPAGLSVAYSTGTNCFNKTASATAFFKVSYK